MLAILAAVAFLLALIFRVASVDTGDFDSIAIIALGLMLLSLHFVYPVTVWQTRRSDRPVP